MRLTTLNLPPWSAWHVIALLGACAGLTMAVWWRL